MKQLISRTTAALLLGLFLLDVKAIAQTPNDQFKGSSWRLVSSKIERGEKTVRLIAPRLQGFLMFDSNDHFLVVITRSGLPSQAATLGKNKATLQRSVACFGTYSINGADHSINIHIEGSTFPKWTGTNQKRQFSVAGDKLELTNSVASGGAGTAELVWQRIK